MTDPAQARMSASCFAVPVDPTREAQAARAVLPHVRPGMAILDLFCGAGWSTLLLAARAGTMTNQQRVVAWDPFEAARSAARDHIVSANFETRVHVSDPAIGAARFDLVYISHRAFAADGNSSTVSDDAVLFARDSLRANGMLAISMPAEAIADGLPALHRAGLTPMCAATGAPVLLPDELRGEGGDVVLLAQRTAYCTGIDLQTHTDQASLLQAFGLDNPGVLLEDDLDAIENDCERHERKRRDAEVLCGLAASHPGPCLDLGTSHGRSAFKLATNIGDAVVTTVNMLPEQAVAAGVHTTHVLPRDDIGRYPRERGVANIQQLYANTLDWNWMHVPFGLHLAFVDACHDEEAVLADSLQAWHRLGSGGFLVWHDFSPALRQVHPWIASSMAGVRRFVDQVHPTGKVHHLLGSWCGVLRKEASDA